MNRVTGSYTYRSERRYLAAIPYRLHKKRLDEIGHLQVPAREIDMLIDDPERFGECRGRVLHPRGETRIPQSHESAYTVFLFPPASLMKSSAATSITTMVIRIETGDSVADVWGMPRMPCRVTRVDAPVME
jgi:hypothetical protein